jgi:hypothetical protein
MGFNSAFKGLKSQNCGFSYCTCLTLREKHDWGWFLMFSGRHKIVVFWGVLQYSLVGSYQCFGETCSLLSFTLSPEATCFSKTLVSVHKAMWCQSSEDSTLLRVFKNSIHRRMFGHEREVEKGWGEHCITRRLITYSLHQVKVIKLRKLLRVRHVADSGS